MATVYVVKVEKKRGRPKRFEDIWAAVRYANRQISAGKRVSIARIGPATLGLTRFQEAHDE